MSNIDAAKKSKQPKEYEYVGARISLDLKRWIEAYCKREQIKSVSKLIEALLLDLREANKGANDAKA